MSGPSCAVANCNSRYDGFRNPTENLSFHSFPKNETRRNIWIAACNRTDAFDPDKSYVCNKHIGDDDFTVMNTKRKLSSPELPRKQLKIETSLTTVTDLLLPAQAVTIDKKISRVIYLRPNENMKLTEENKKLIMQLNNFERELKVGESELNLLKKEKMLIDQTVATLIKQDELFSKTISEAQFNVLTRKTKSINWPVEDICKAIAIKYLSHEGFVHVKNILKYPLPSSKILNRWVSKFNFLNGIQPKVLELMKIGRLLTSTLHEICVLQFGEMSVKEMYEYDKLTDCVFGPYATIQVILVQGLISNWQQIIYVDFDKKIDKHVLFDAIEKLWERSYNVVACVSDCGHNSINLWQHLGVTTNKVYFFHPVTTKKIYCFIDTSHLINLLRNSLLKKGFVYPNGEKLTKEPLVELANLSKKLKGKSCKLEKVDIEDMNITYYNTVSATKLFSHSTSNLLLNHQEYFSINVPLEMVQFISIVRSWFDVMTNNILIDNKSKWNDYYGLHLASQNKILDKMCEIISNVRCIGEESLKFFQEAIILSINSLKQLFFYLKQTYANVEYIITKTLTLDSLQNIFMRTSQQNCQNLKVSPLSIIYKIKNISFNNKLFITANVISKAQITVDIPYPVSTVLDLLFHYSNQTCMAETEKKTLLSLCKCISSKFNEKYNYLVLSTSTMENKSFKSNRQSYEKWLPKVKQFEEIFKSYHGDNICTKNNVVKNVTDLIKKDNPNFPGEIIEYFVLRRTFLRINILNDLRMENKIVFDIKKRWETMGLTSKKKNILITVCTE